MTSQDNTPSELTDSRVCYSTGGVFSTCHGPANNLTDDPDLVDCLGCLENMAEQVEQALLPPPDFSAFPSTHQGIMDALQSIPGVVAVDIETHIDTPSIFDVRARLGPNAPPTAREHVELAVNEVKPFGVGVNLCIEETAVEFPAW